ncbi:MAG: hypothetical protein EOO01_30100, partial [Chitinophagaceae bacterium]
MLLRITPSQHNVHPVQGIFIKGNAPALWLQLLKSCGFDIMAVQAFAVAGTTPNSVSGCVVVCKADVRHLDIGRNEFLQLVRGRLFVPMHTALFPETDAGEWNQLLGQNQAVLFPETGLSILETPIDWKQIVETPRLRNAAIRVPAKTRSTPQLIATIFVEPNPDEIQDAFGPPDKKLPFNVQKVLNGNNREIDKYLKFLESNPEQALKLGIPLDANGSSRGRQNVGWKKKANFLSNPDTVTKFAIAFLLIVVAVFIIIKMSEHGVKGPAPIFLLIILLARLFSSDNSSGTFGGTRTVGDDRFAKLQLKYEELARKYKENGDYRKAAHIENKLLKRALVAARTLEEGKHFHEAAMLYLTLGNKELAANAYDKGLMCREAAELYKTIGEHEKAGDMFAKINQRSKALELYAFAASEHIKKKQYVKASLLY